MKYNHSHSSLAARDRKLAALARARWREYPLKASPSRSAAAPAGSSTHADAAPAGSSTHADAAPAGSSTHANAAPAGVSPPTDTPAGSSTHAYTGPAAPPACASTPAATEVSCGLAPSADFSPSTCSGLRVAAYCRVSTDTAEQESSAENQKKHYQSLITSNPGWEFAGIYWETGVSGTRKESRPELQRLLKDCANGRIDLVLTKSISRFARNTTDCLEMIRTLTELGVSVRFEKENIDTGTMESELMLTLFASFSQEESLSISRNTSWAKRRQFRDGTFRYSIAPYGFKLVDGNFEPDPAQAAIVREIYDSVLSGKGTPRIARELNSRSIPTGTRRRDGTPGIWTSSMLCNMIPNVVYIGDVLMQKTFRDEMLRLRPNRGERPQYYIEAHHEAIVDRETFMLANAAFRQRGIEKGNIPHGGENSLPQRGIEEGNIPRDGENSLPQRGGCKLPGNSRQRKYAFSGKLRCACCGSTLRRITQRTASGKQYHWGCKLHISDISRCSMRREYEESIQNAFYTMLNKLVYAESIFLSSELIRSERAARALKECLRRWKTHSGDAFPEQLFSEMVSHAVVQTGVSVSFHLSCGLVLTEPLVSCGLVLTEPLVSCGPVLTEPPA